MDNQFLIFHWLCYLKKSGVLLSSSHSNGNLYSVFIKLGNFP